MSRLVRTRRELSARMAKAWHVKPIHEKKVSPTEAMATPVQMTMTM